MLPENDAILHNELNKQEFAKYRISNRKVSSVPLLLAEHRVIIVESHPVDRIRLQIDLTRAGAWASVASNTQEAQTLLKRIPYADLILLSDQAPEDLNSCEIFKIIRDMKTHANTPIIVISQVYPSAGITLCLNKGVAGYINKPISRQNFLIQIANILAGTSQWNSTKSN